MLNLFRNKIVIFGLTFAVVCFAVVGVIYKNYHSENYAGFINSKSREEAVRNKAEVFVSTFGTYNADSYNSYVEEVRDFTTDNFYNENFSGDKVSQKLEALKAIEASFTSTPEDPGFGVNAVFQDDNQAIAELDVIEKKQIANGELIEEKVFYSIGLVKVDDRWLVDTVTVSRGEQQIAATQEGQNTEEGTTH